MVSSNLLKLWPSLNLVSHCLRTDSQLEQQTANIANGAATLWCITTADCSDSVLKKRNHPEALACLIAGWRVGAQAPLFYTNLLLVLVLLCLDSPEAALVRVITFWGLETKAHLENLVAVFTLGKIYNKKNFLAVWVWSGELWASGTVSRQLCFAFAPWTVKFCLEIVVL